MLRRVSRLPLKLNSTALSFLNWEVDGVGRVKVEPATMVALRTIDEQWTPLRRASHQNTHWSWAEIGRRKSERFAVTAEGNPVAVWCSSRSECIKLDGDLFYRLDFFEVHPSFRGGDLSTFALATVAARALELSACGMVLECFEEVVPFYTDHGATPGAPGRWRTTPKLLAFTFRSEQLAELKEALDGLLVEPVEDGEGCEIP